MANILVVDDDSKMRETIGSIFEDVFDGVHSVQFAEDGQVGLIIFKEKHPDLIISDFNMPKMNGDELAKIVLRADPNQPFIGMTGEIEDNQTIYKQAGVQQIIPKPFKVADFVAAVSSALGQKS